MCIIELGASMLSYRPDKPSSLVIEVAKVGIFNDFENLASRLKVNLTSGFWNKSLELLA